MSLSPNEKEAVATALKGVDKATHAMLKALIAARNDLHERKEDNNG